MKSEIAYVRSLNEDVRSSDFFARVYASPELARDFGVTKFDATAVRSVLRDWIVENGISSLFNYQLTCDAVMHPGIRVDEIEDLILGFLRALKGVRHLFIIDQYFYSSEPSVLALFEKMMSEVSDSLETVTFFSKRRLPADRAPMHSILTNLKAGIRIRDVETTEFHDRFWIDPDSERGLVMGTSLNGVTKKIALIDHLRQGDVAQLAAMAQALCT